MFKFKTTKKPLPVSHETKSQIVHYEEKSESDSCTINKEEMQNNLDTIESFFSFKYNAETSEGFLGVNGEVTIESLRYLNNTVGWDPHYKEDQHLISLPDYYFCDKIVCEEEMNIFNKKKMGLYKKVINALQTDEIRKFSLILDTFRTDSTDYNNPWLSFIEKESERLKNFEETFYLVDLENSTFDSKKNKVDAYKNFQHSHYVWRYKETSLVVYSKTNLMKIIGVSSIKDLVLLKTHWDEELFETIHGLYNESSMTLKEAHEAAENLINY